MKNFYIFLLIAVFTAFSQMSYAQQWMQIGEDINGEAAGDESGNSIDLSADGNIIAIGAWQNDGNGDNSGHVRIFENINGVWTQIGNDIEGQAGEKKGYAVSMNDAGNIVALSTPYVNSNTGKVSVYKNTDGNWTQLGNDIPGKGEYYYSGVSIELSPAGDQIAISNHANVGFIRIYNYENENWTLSAEISGTVYNEQLGGSGLKFNKDASVLAARTGSYGNHEVKFFKKDSNDNWSQVWKSISAPSSFSLNNDFSFIAIGNSNWFGTVQVYEVKTDTMIQIGNDLGGWFTGTGYANTVQINSEGNLVMVSAPGNNFSTGLIRFYELKDGEWIKKGDDLEGVGQYDNFGSKICFTYNDSILAVTAPKNDANGEDAGQVRVFKVFECSAINEEMNLSLCENDLPYTFGEQTLTTSGDYTETFTTINGCDSVVTLHFNTNPTYSDTITEIISDAETPYLFGSQSLSTSGIYTENFASVYGCDSLVTINLTVNITGNKIIEDKEEEFSIYPNPSNGIIYIKVKEQSLSAIQVSVYDLSMRQLSLKSFTTDQMIKLDLSDLPGGQYITTIKTNDDIITRKITLSK